MPSTPRSLVSASSLKTGPGSSRPSSDQVPEDRIAECSSLQRRGDVGGGGVVGGDRVDGRVEVVVGEDAAELRARLHQRAERARRQAERARSAPATTRPCARPAAPWWRRSCARWRARRSASRRAGPGPARSAAAAPRQIVRQQLVDGVDRHVLDAGDLVALHALRHPRCARRGSGRGDPARGGARPAARSRRPRCRRRRRRSGGRRSAPTASVNRCSRFQRSPSGSRTGRFANRWHSSSEITRAVEVPADHAAAGRAQVDRGEVSQGGTPLRGARRSARASNSGAISACQRAFTSVSSIARLAASKSAVSR